MCKEAKLLLVVSTLFTLANGLSGIFINVFFWRETNDFVIIAIYNLLHYIAIPINFVLAGLLSKKKDGIWSLRVGLAMFALFYSLILLTENKGISYIYMLGIVNGIAAGFYWLSFSTLCFDFTAVTNRDTFNGYNGSMTGAAGAIAPIASGYIISRFAGVKGYNIIFVLTLALFIVLILISLRLKCESCNTKIDFKRIFSKNCDEWVIIRKATMFWGFRDTVIGFLVSILIIEVTKSEFSLGTLTLIGSILSALGFVAVQKIIKPRRRIASIYIGTILSFLAVLALVIKVCYSSIVIFTILNSFFLPFYIIQLSSSTFNVINRAHEEDLRIEYMINKEIALNLGRILSSVILIILLIMFKSHYTLRTYLLFIGIMPVISGYILSKLRKMLISES